MKEEKMYSTEIGEYSTHCCYCWCRKVRSGRARVARDFYKINFQQQTIPRPEQYAGVVSKIAHTTATKVESQAG
jgi:hypothetical protein